jgi:hypothetical protein
MDDLSMNLSPPSFDQSQPLTATSSLLFSSPPITQPITLSSPNASQPPLAFAAPSNSLPQPVLAPTLPLLSYHPPLPQHPANTPLNALTQPQSQPTANPVLTPTVAAPTSTSTSTSTATATATAKPKTKKRKEPATPGSEAKAKVGRPSLDHKGMTHLKNYRTFQGCTKEYVDFVLETNLATNTMSVSFVLYVTCTPPQLCCVCGVWQALKLLVVHSGHCKQLHEDAKQISRSEFPLPPSADVIKALLSSASAAAVCELAFMQFFVQATEATDCGCSGYGCRATTCACGCHCACASTCPNSLSTDAATHIRSFASSCAFFLTCLCACASSSACSFTFLCGMPLPSPFPLVVAYVVTVRNIRAIHLSAVQSRLHHNHNLRAPE